MLVRLLILIDRGISLHVGISLDLYGIILILCNLVVRMSLEGVLSSISLITGCIANTKDTTNNTRYDNENNCEKVSEHVWFCCTFFPCYHDLTWCVISIMCPTYSMLCANISSTRDTDTYGIIQKVLICIGNLLATGITITDGRFHCQ